MIETLQVKKEADPYLAGFDRVETDGAAQQPSWVSSLRKAGISRFAEFGFPTLRDENWRFTNVATIAKLPFRPALIPQAHGITRETLAQFLGRLDTGGLGVNYDPANLLLNGFEIESATDVQEQVILTVAAGQMQRDAFTEWLKAYVEHEKMGKKSILFVMTDDTKNCDEVAAYLEDH